MSNIEEKVNKPGQFWGIHFVCISCGEFRWRMDGEEHSKEKFDKLSEKHKSENNLLLSNAMDNVMCWICQFEKRKQNPLFQPPEPNFLDPEKSAYGKKWAESVNDLLQNAVFTNKT